MPVIPPEAIVIYPNPASEMLTVDLSDVRINTGLDITLVNATGNSFVNKKDYRDRTMQIDVSELSEGVYFLRFTNGSSVVVKKVMVRR